MIRPARLNDIPAIKDCAKAAYEMYVERIGREPAPMQANFAGLLKSHQMDVFVHENELAGYVAYIVEDNAVLLENVAVHPRFAGHRIGRRLIDNVERFTLESGLPAVTLYTNVAMSENLELYPKLGYIETHRAEEDGFSRVYFKKNIQTDVKP